MSAVRLSLAIATLIAVQGCATAPARPAQAAAAQVKVAAGQEPAGDLVWDLLEALLLGAL